MGECRLAFVRPPGLGAAYFTVAVPCASTVAGKTVFVPEATNSAMNVLYSRFMTKHRRKLRRRTSEVGGKHGFVVWLDEH